MDRQATLFLSCLALAPLHLVLFSGCGARPDSAPPTAHAEGPGPRELVVDSEARILRPDCTADLAPVPHFGPTRLTGGVVRLPEVNEAAADEAGLDACWLLPGEVEALPPLPDGLLAERMPLLLPEIKSETSDAAPAEKAPVSLPVGSPQWRDHLVRNSIWPLPPVKLPAESEEEIEPIHLPLCPLQSSTPDPLPCFGPDDEEEGDLPQRTAPSQAIPDVLEPDVLEDGLAIGPTEVPDAAGAKDDDAEPVLQEQASPLASRDEAPTGPRQTEDQQTPESSASAEASTLEKAESLEAIRQARAMHAVTERAAQHVRTGFSLAGRGAYFSARSEFILALRVLSQAHDEAGATMRHSAALAAGLRALEESDDFIPRGAKLEARLKIETLVPAHQTPVLKQDSLESVTALAARRKYYTYAQEQLALAAGDNRAGSMALYGLARVQTTLAHQQPSAHPAADPKAMVFHQAALLVDNENYMAAHELGVLLARYGQYEDARTLLVHSLHVVPLSVAWQNLAAVHERLGELELAAQARHNAQYVARMENPLTGGRENGISSVMWTDAKTFAATSAPGPLPAARAPQDKTIKK